jgi:hypothetical protein
VRRAGIHLLALLAAFSLGAFVQGCGGGGSGSGGGTTQSFVMAPANGTTLPPATTAGPYQQLFSVQSGGTPPYTYTSISIPAGLSLAPVTGSTTDALLSGTPTKTGDAIVSFQVVDSTNQKFSNESYKLSVN